MKKKIAILAIAVTALATTAATTWANFNCRWCQGTGRVRANSVVLHGGGYMWTRCTFCNGTGFQGGY